MILRMIFAAAAVFAAACSPSPPAEAPQPPAAPAADAATQALLDALAPIVSNEIGQPVSLQATTVNMRDEWAYIIAQPRMPDGSAIEWSRTNLSSRHANGVLDGDGVTYALLKNVDGAWTVLEHAVGPTDVAWIEWASEHGAPADILGLPSH